MAVNALVFFLIIVCLLIILLLLFALIFIVDQELDGLIAKKLKKRFGGDE